MRVESKPVQIKEHNSSYWNTLEAHLYHIIII